MTGMLKGLLKPPSAGYIETLHCRALEQLKNSSLDSTAEHLQCCPTSKHIRFWLSFHQSTMDRQFFDVECCFNLPYPANSLPGTSPSLSFVSSTCKLSSHQFYASGQMLCCYTAKHSYNLQLKCGIGFSLLIYHSSNHS